MPAKNYFVLPGVDWVNGAPVPPGRVVLLTDGEAAFDLQQGRIVLGSTQPPEIEPEPPILASDMIVLKRGNRQLSLAVEDLAAFIGAPPARTLSLSTQTFLTGTASGAILAAITAPGGWTIAAETTFGGRVAVSGSNLVAAQALTAAATGSARLRASSPDGSESITKTFDLVVEAAAAPEMTVSGTPGAATIGQPYLFMPTVSGGTAPYTFTYTADSLAGLTGLPTTGSLTGTPNAVGAFANIRLTVEDSSTPKKTASLAPFTLLVGDELGPKVGIYQVAPGPDEVNIIDFVGLISGERVENQVPVNGRIAIAGGGLAAERGATASTDGTISYTFTTNFKRSFTVALTATSDNVAPVLTVPTAITVAEGQPWSLQITADDPAAEVTLLQEEDAEFFTLTGGTLSLPPLDFEAPLDDATVNGSNTYRAALQIKDQAGNTGVQVITVTVTNDAEAAAPVNSTAPTISGSPVVGQQLSGSDGTWSEASTPPTLGALTLSPSTATVGLSFSGEITGKTAGSTLSLAGSGAAGLSASGSTISGTPTTAGTVDVIETLAGATGSPRTTSGLLTVAAAAPAPTYTLDTLSTPAALALTLRKARSAYNGPVVKIRRSSDNAVQDFGFGLDGVIDMAAVLAFTGTTVSSAGYVDTWYDQSGNGYHATQPSAAAQPYLVYAGAFVLSNGRPQMVFGNNTSLLIPTLDAGRMPRSFRIVAAKRSTSNSDLIKSSANGGPHIRVGATTHPLQLLKQGSAVIGATTEAATMNATSTFAVDVDASTFALNIDGDATPAVTGTHSQPFTAGGTLMLGGSSTVTNAIQSVAIFDAILSSADSAAIQASQKAFYGTA